MMSWCYPVDWCSIDGPSLTLCPGPLAPALHVWMVAWSPACPANKGHQFKPAMCSIRHSKFARIYEHELSGEK